MGLEARKHWKKCWAAIALGALITGCAAVIPTDEKDRKNTARPATTPAAISAAALANATYPSKLVESGTATLTDGRYRDEERGITITLIPEHLAHATLEGEAVAAVLLAENGGGSGTFVTLVLVRNEAGQPVAAASTFLGDRPRVKQVAINDEGTVTVDMVQVGANDKFCCPATPMRVSYAYQEGQLIGGQLTSATIDTTGYAGQANAFILPATAYDRSEPPGGHGEPGHFAWTFGTDMDLDVARELARALTPGSGYVAVYPVAPYRAIWTAAGDPFVADTLAALQRLLDQRPADHSPPLPVLPMQNATNDFAAQIAYLDLPGGGRGVRFVGRFAQDAAPLRNYQLRYVFQGLSADGETLVVASLPIATTALPDDAEVATADPAAPERDIVVHLEQWRKAFNALEPAQFTPTLAALDALLESVTVTTTNLSDPK